MKWLISINKSDYVEDPFCLSSFLKIAPVIPISKNTPKTITGKAHIPIRFIPKSNMQQQGT